MFESLLVMFIFWVIINNIWSNKKKPDPKDLPWLFRPLWLPDDKKSGKSNP